MNNLPLALSFLKNALDGIKAMIAVLDDAIPEGGQGQIKLDLLKGWVDAAIAAEARYTPAATLIWTLVAPLVGALVAARKAKAA